MFRLKRFFVVVAQVIAKRRERLENEKELDDDILTYLMTTQYRLLFFLNFSLYTINSFIEETAVV